MVTTLTAVPEVIDCWDMLPLRDRLMRDQRLTERQANIRLAGRLVMWLDEQARPLIVTPNGTLVVVLQEKCARCRTADVVSFLRPGEDRSDFIDYHTGTYLAPFTSDVICDACSPRPRSHAPAEKL